MIRPQDIEENTQKSGAGADVQQFAFKGEMSAGDDGVQKVFDRHLHWIGNGVKLMALSIPEAPGHARPCVFQMGRVEFYGTISRAPSPARPTTLQIPPTSSAQLSIFCIIGRGRRWLGHRIEIHDDGVVDVHFHLGDWISFFEDSHH